MILILQDDRKADCKDCCEMLDEWPGMCRLQSQSSAKSTETWKDAVTRCHWQFAGFVEASWIWCIASAHGQERRQYEESGVWPSDFFVEWRVLNRIQMYPDGFQMYHGVPKQQTTQGTQPSQQKFNFWSTYTNKATAWGRLGHMLILHSWLVTCDAKVEQMWPSSSKFYKDERCLEDLRSTELRIASTVIHDSWSRLF